MFFVELLSFICFLASSWLYLRGQSVGFARVLLAAGSLLAVSFLVYDYSVSGITSWNSGTSLLAGASIVSLLFVVLGKKYPGVGSIASPLVASMTACAMLFESMGGNQLCDSSLLGLHIAPVVVGHICFVVSFISALTLLLQEKLLKTRSRLKFISTFPPLVHAERICFMSASLGLWIMAIGIVSGIILAPGCEIELSLFDWRIIGSLVALATYGFGLVGYLFLARRGRTFAFTSIYGFGFSALTFALTKVPGLSFHVW